MISIPISHRETFLGKNIDIQLGGLAADLARVASFVRIPALAPTETMLEESRAFIEWCAPGLVPERLDDAARLVEIQRSLTYWYHRWDQIVNDSIERHKLAEQAQAWSDEVLKMSGLLDKE